MNRFSWILLFLTALLFTMGILMVFNITSAEAVNRLLYQHTHNALIKQCIYALVSLSFAFLIWFFGYEKIVGKAPILFFLICFMLLLVFIPGIGQQINGAYRWMGIGKLACQPSEFAKIAIPLYFIYRFKKSEWSFHRKEFLRVLALLALPIALIFREPDNGSAAIILANLVALFFIARVKWLYWALPLCIMVFSGVGFALQMPHVKERLQVYLNPNVDILGKGHQPYQAKIAAGSGGLVGRGVGESLQKLEYLPEARSDYIAAIYAEEFGYIGILLLILLYMLIACLGFQMASKANTKEGFYLIASLTFLITFQAFLNLGVVSGLLPSKGTNLPFFSQGGSSLFSNTIALTLILNVAKGKMRCRKSV